MVLVQCLGFLSIVVLFLPIIVLVETPRHLLLLLLFLMSLFLCTIALGSPSPSPMQSSIFNTTNNQTPSSCLNSWMPSSNFVFSAQGISFLCHRRLQLDSMSSTRDRNTIFTDMASQWQSPFQRGILKGDVALVTGGGSGIGLEISRRVDGASWSCLDCQHAFWQMKENKKNHTNTRGREGCWEGGRERERDREGGREREREGERLRPPSSHAKFKFHHCRRLTRGDLAAAWIAGS
jgi:hypothetical protein